MSEKQLHLQGLRGFAIIAVILFHFFPEYCPNGYLGVDQFFLLSGYLMTMMLHRHSSLNRSKLVDFLYRRVKRIVPMYYLTTFLILSDFAPYHISGANSVSLNFAPISSWSVNVKSSIIAIFFSTNLIRPTGSEGYAEKLGLAVDMFTHTWSLALEIQFYLLFPLIFTTVKLTTEERRNYVIGIFGMAVFNFQKTLDTIDPEAQEKLLDEEEVDVNEDLRKLLSIICGVSMVSLVALMFCPHAIDPLFGRINTILLTSLIVYLGGGSQILECKLLVSFGEISYCWYLVHWPFVAHFKLNGFKCQLDLAYAMFGSYFLSVILHNLFEKKYLTWDKKTIFGVLFVLLTLNGGAILQITGNMPKDISSGNISLVFSNSSVIFNEYFYKSDYIGNITMGYEDKTNDERASLNTYYDANDADQLHKYPCTRIKTSNQREKRCMVGKINSKINKNFTLLVMGNSYAQNIMGVVHDECRDIFKIISITATPSCEPLVRSKIDGTDCSTDLIFNDAVNYYQPDVLFIIYRHITDMTIQNGSNPFDDNNFETAVSRLQEIEKLVKERIYILDAFPQVTNDITKILNNFLTKGISFTDESLTDRSQKYIVSKERMSRLVSGCKKCKLFDYATQFFINGQFKVYDPKYYVSYFTKGLHLSPAGLERVRPLIRHICHHL